MHPYFSDIIIEAPTDLSIGNSGFRRPWNNLLQKYVMLFIKCGVIAVNVMDANDCNKKHRVIDTLRANISNCDLLYRR